jgi:hypothetical protein
MRLRIISVAALVGLVAALGPVSAAVASDGPDDDGFDGVVQTLPATPGFVGDWVVSGTTVHVSADTEIDDDHGAIVVGATVEVEGTANADGTFTASEIEVTRDDDDDDGDDDDEGDDDADFGRIEFEGFVQSLPAAGFVGDWRVSGLLVHVTASTEVEQDDGPIVVGTAVEVKGTLAADGSVTASKIEVEDDGDADDSMSLTGTVTTVPNNANHRGMWRVSRHDVKVGRSTAVVHEARLATGSKVRVIGTFRSDGSIRASRIVVKR